MSSNFKIDSIYSGLVYSSYLGSDYSQYGDGIYGLRVDSDGNIYIAGYTCTKPTPPGTSNPNAYIMKIKADGSEILYTTYLGGDISNYAPCYITDLDIDGNGNAYVVGYTTASNFPTKNAYQSSLQGKQNVIVAKIDSSGEISYSTYIGGNNTDFGNSIWVDANQCVYITGYTNSTNFPTAMPYQNSLAKDNDVFVTKFNKDGKTLAYSTYLGGSGEDYGYGITVDLDGCAYVTGHTTSSDFPVKNAYQSFKQGINSAFLTKLTPTGSNLTYSTYLGGIGNDYGYSIVVDEVGLAYVTGATSSTNFPVVNPIKSSLEPGTITNAFITTFNKDGKTLKFSTYLGGSNSDSGSAIGLNNDGNIVVTGQTNSIDFPTVDPIQANNAGYTDAFVTEVNSSNPSSIVFSTYLGGDNLDFGNDIIKTLESYYVAGTTFSKNFPITDNAIQAYIKGVSDGFISVISQKQSVEITKTSEQSEVYIGDTITYSISLTNNGLLTLNNVVINDELPVQVKFLNISVSSGSAIYSEGMINWKIGNVLPNDTVTATIVVRALSIGNVLNKAYATWNNMTSPIPIEVVAYTQIMTKLSTGPLTKGVKCGHGHCSEKDGKVGIVINNTTSNLVDIDVLLYDLKCTEENTGEENIFIDPYGTKTLLLDCLPKLYRIDFDKVIQGVYFYLTITYCPRCCECGYEGKNEENIMYHTQLINLLEL